MESRKLKSNEHLIMDKIMQASCEKKNVDVEKSW